MIKFYHNTFIFTFNSSNCLVSASWLSATLPNFSSSAPDGPGEAPWVTEREEVGLEG